MAWARDLIEDPAAAAEVAWAGWSDNLVLRVGSAFLKTGRGLKAERERMQWLRRRLPAPKVLGYGTDGDLEWLLTRALPGQDLTVAEHRARPEWLSERLADALKRLHALEPADCPFGEPGPGRVVVHGDACLPNFLFAGDEFTGYVDLGQLGLAEVEVDLAAAVWSLGYNLGPGFGGRFLAAYGYPSDEETVSALERRYAEDTDWQAPAGPTWPVKD